MKYIAYNTTLDIKTLIETTENDYTNKKAEEIRIFNENKEQLLPHVLALLHYLVTFHNEYEHPRLLTTHGGERNGARLLDTLYGKKIDMADYLATYTKDNYFSTNGGYWDCGSLSVRIWLNKDSVFVYNSKLPYSIIANGAYYDSVEHYAETKIKNFINKK
jgi:hypothetical protein